MFVEVTQGVRTRVLVVEDEALVAAWLRMLLEGLGYEVVGTFSSAEDALPTVSEKAPDLVLMDINLRGSMDGVAAAAEIRSGSEIPIVFTTAYADAETIARATETGPYGYLVKPFDERALRSAVEIALARSGLERQLREQERFHRATLMAIGDGVISADAQGRAILMNPIAEELTGWRDDEARGRDLGEIARFEPVDTEHGDPLEEALRRRGAGRVLLRRDGRRIPVEMEVSRYQGGSVLVLRDVTQRLAVEETLRRTERLSAMGLLLWGFAHEARNPLFGMTATLELLEEDLAAGSIHSDHLARLRTGIGRLQRLIQGVQELPHSAPALPSAQDLGQLLELAISSCDAAAAEAGVSISLDLPDGFPIVQGHESPLLQMLAHLVLNAVQHSDRGATVWIRGSLLADRRLVAIDVEDSGPGLTDDQLELIFEPFHAKREGGLGLGLTQARRIAEEHGGSIVAERRAGTGSRFRITLPTSADPPALPLA